MRAPKPTKHQLPEVLTSWGAWTVSVSTVWLTAETSAKIAEAGMPAPAITATVRTMRIRMRRMPVMPGPPCRREWGARWSGAASRPGEPERRRAARGRPRGRAGPGSRGRARGRRPAAGTRCRPRGLRPGVDRRVGVTLGPDLDGAVGAGP